MTLNLFLRNLFIDFLQQIKYRIVFVTIYGNDDFFNQTFLGRRVITDCSLNAYIRALLILFQIYFRSCILLRKMLIDTYNIKILYTEFRFKNHSWGNANYFKVLNEIENMTAASAHIRHYEAVVDFGGKVILKLGTIF